MDEQHATAGGRRGEALCERIAAGWSTLRTAVVDWLDEQTAFGVSRRAVIGGRARTVAIATVGACATVTLWAWIGPGVVATAREIVEWTIASGPDQQDAVIAVAIGAVLIAWWIRWAARRRIASSLIARTASDHAVAALVGPGRVDERVARHEAAPAVVASALGAKVLRVRAIPDGTAGRCEWAFDVPGQSAVENAWVTLCALAAGEVEVPEGPAAWPGASSDTHEALADLWDVSLNTVRGAQSTLAAEGLLVAVQGVGVFVADVLPSRDPLEVAQRELQVALREHEEASRRLADAVRAVDAALPGSAVRA